MWIDNIAYRILALAGWLAMPLAAPDIGASPLGEQIGKRRCETYIPAPVDTLRQAQAAFADLLQGPRFPPDSAPGQWQALGFELLTLAEHGEQWLVLREPTDTCRGQGLYLIRLGATPGLMLQVPHGYRDLHTDDIAAGLLQVPWHVIAFNTVPRHYTRRGRRVDADLAHREDSFLAALTRAYADIHPAGRLVQLHGFSPQKRSTAAGRSAAAIISSGAAWPSAGAIAVADCLQRRLQEPVRLYPRDVRELGGTRNVQGRLLRERGHDGFVHVELARPLRERLRKEQELRSGLAACLGSGMSGE